MTFSGTLDTIYITCSNTILHFSHTGISMYHRLVTKQSNFFSKSVVLCNRAQVSFVRWELSLCVLFRLVSRFNSVYIRNYFLDKKCVS
jgi:hypothetical protein